MKIEKVVEGALGVYLILPGLEDVGTAGITLAPSVILGLALVADAFEVKI